MSSRRPAEGSATIDDLFYWMNERHRIWKMRDRGERPPWTDDPILRYFKFTNVYRELDKGTLALRNMIGVRPGTTLKQTVFNVFWYRLFNRYEHATNIGWCNDFDEFHVRLEREVASGRRLFTSAHMSLGMPGEPKWITMLVSARTLWEHPESAFYDRSIQEWFNFFRTFQGCGAFISYEMACDMRFEQFDTPPDVHTWANIGPGAYRGMHRIGLPETVESMRFLRLVALNGDSNLLRKKYAIPRRVAVARSYFHEVSHHIPFELREIEHSLCEFDKYQRALRGEGTPKERFNESLRSES